MSFTILGSEPVEGGLVVDVQVPSDCPFFRGHFPRFPTLPAVALLDLIAKLGDAHTDFGGRPSSLRGLRLRGTITPEAKLQIKLMQGPDSIGFSVSVDGKAGTKGRFGFENVSAPQIPTSALAKLAANGPSEPAPSLPHEGPALMIQDVLARDLESVLCRAIIPATSAFRSRPKDGQANAIPALLAIELCAQASAAHGEGEPGGGSDAAEAGRGFLVNVKDAWFTTERLPADQEYFIEARQTTVAAPLRNYAGTLRNAAGDLLASVQLGTWVP
ncbi:MAG: putative hotdog family 3-hydroxylacyl-ACP dehydratase [Planctomycetota bacterium]|jgi:predicted hotdog family 3-hydroxylacyl-ACP dehydratase